MFIYFVCPLLFVLKYDFHVDAERMIVKTPEMYRIICVDGLNMHVTIPLT